MSKYIANYAIDIDNRTLEQFKSCYELPFVEKAALMPDAHAGYVAPIGAVLITKDYIVPSWVGFDIGCGVTAIKITNKNILEKIINKKDEIYKEVNKAVPMGLGNLSHPQTIHRSSIEKLQDILAEFIKKNHDPEVYKILKNKGISNLGTLGEGNHFIELGTDGAAPWIIIHTGSRNIGHKIATIYMKKAAKNEKEYEKTHALSVTSNEGKEYLNTLHTLLEFALLNRIEISLKVLDALEVVLKEKINFEIWTNKNHNHALEEEGFFIHRKGATPAQKGERGVIPGNMRDGSYLVEGLGNEAFLNSSSHGAGRKMSRHQARKEISLNQFKESMKGITATLNEQVIDEAPDAYKNISDVMDAQKDSVKIIAHIRPIINWKG